MDLKIILTDTNSQDLTTQGSSITTSDSEVLFEVNVDNLATLYGGESDSAIEELMDDTWDEDDINILEDYYNEFIREDSGEQFDRSSYEYISVAYHENEKNYNEKGEEVLSNLSAEDCDYYAEQIYYSIFPSEDETVEKSFLEQFNYQDLTTDDWLNIFQSYENKYNDSLIKAITLASITGTTEKNTCEEIIDTISSKLLEAIENGNEDAINITCNELYSSLCSNMRGVNLSFVNDILNNGNNEAIAQISKNYNSITGSDLISDFSNNSSIAKADFDLIIQKLNSIQQGTISATEELDLNNYGVEDQNKAWTINILIEALNSSISNFQDQNNEDGSVTNGFNVIKALTGLFGLSSDDVISALTEEEQLIQELTKALNGESETYSSFEEAYYALTGVEYDDEKVIEYQENANNYALACSMVQKAQNFQNSISNADNLQDVYDLYVNYYGDEEKAKEEFLSYIQDGMIPNEDDYDDIYYEKVAAFGGYVTSVEFNDDGQLVITRVTNYITSTTDEDYKYLTIAYDLSEIDMNQIMPGTFDSTRYVNQALDKVEECFGSSLEELQEAYANSKQEALGTADILEETVNQYCESQDGFEEKLASIVQIAGIGFTAVGGVVSFVNPPAGLALMKVGNCMALSGMFGDEVLETIDGLTSNDGLSNEEIADLIKETATELGYLALGSGINSVAEAVQIGSLEALQAAGFSETSAKVVSWFAEAGTDMALSALSDLAITGNLNLSGNSLQVLMGVLTGVARAKINSLKCEKISELNEKLVSGEISPSEIEPFLSDTFSSKEIFEIKCESLGISDVVNIDPEIFLKNFGLEYDESQTEMFKKLIVANIDAEQAITIVNSGVSPEKLTSFIELYNSGLTSTDVLISGLNANWSKEHWDIYRMIVDENEYNRYSETQRYESPVKYDWSSEELANYRNYLKEGKKPEVAAILATDSLSETQIRTEIAKLGLKQYQSSPYINSILRSAQNPEVAAEKIGDFGDEFAADFILHGYDDLSYPAPEDMVVNRFEISTRDYQISYNVGDEITAETFYSTTSDLSDSSWAATTWIDEALRCNGDATSERYKFEIHIPKGAPITTGDDVMGEVLLKYGSKFRVTAVDTGTNTYILKYVS